MTRPTLMSVPRFILGLAGVALVVVLVGGAAVILSGVTSDSASIAATPTRQVIPEVRRPAANRPVRPLGREDTERRDRKQHGELRDRGAAVRGREVERSASDRELTRSTRESRRSDRRPTEDRPLDRRETGGEGDRTGDE